MRPRASCDDVQLYLARGAVLHPQTYRDFLEDIHLLSKKGLVSPAPITLFERFHLLRMNRRVG